jgi:hypothetical protein
LQKLHENRAASILTFSSYDANADALLASIGWKKLQTQRKIQKVVMLQIICSPYVTSIKIRTVQLKIIRGSEF